MIFHMDHRTYNYKNIIYKEGDIPQYIYFIKRGQVEIIENQQFPLIEAKKTLSKD